MITVTDPGYLTHLSRGGELLKSDRLGEAKTEFERALVVRPGDPKALALLGLACFRLGSYDEATAIYQTLVEQSPDDAGLRLNLGLVHLKANATDSAIAELERAIALEPGQVRAKGYLGLAYARKADYAKARDAFRDSGQLELAQEMDSVLHAAGASERHEKSLIAEPPPGAKVDVIVTDDPGDDALAVTDESLKRVEREGFEKIEASGGSLAGIDELAARARARGDIRWSGPVSLDETTTSLVAAAARHTLEMRPRMGGAQPLASFLHSRIVMPAAAKEPFEIHAAGSLVVRVRGRMVSRTDGVVASGGELAYTPALRRRKGRMTEESLGTDDSPVFEIAGEGYLVALPRGGRFIPLRLDEDALYIREEAVYAFEPGTLRWESGRVPGSEAATRPLVEGQQPPGIRFINLRGDGTVCIRARRGAVTVQVSPEWVSYVDAHSLIGWSGKVVPRVAPGASPDAAVFVEVTGDGVVIIEEPEPI